MGQQDATTGKAGADRRRVTGWRDPGVDVVRTVALAANTAATLHEALTAAATAVCDATGWPACVVWQTTDGQHLAPTVVARDGATEVALTGLGDLEPVTADGLGVAASMFRADAAAVIYQVDDQGGPVEAIARGAGLRTGATFAVTADGHVAAVLEFLTPEDVVPSRALVADLDTVVRQLSYVARREPQRGEVRGPGDLGLSRSFERSTDAFIALDADGHVQAWNRQAQLLFGWTLDQVRGRADALGWLTPPVLTSTPGSCPLTRLAVDADEAGRTVRLTLRHRYGTEVPVWATAWAPRGSGLATALLLRPITADDDSWQGPGAASGGRDPVTGLATRPVFLERLAGLLTGTATVVLAVVDIDRLSDVNRRYSPATGDAALAAVARRLSTFAGTAGRVSRWGDDEIALALTHVDSSEAGLRRLGWELIELFEAPLENIDPPLTVGVSVGLATSRDLGEDAVTAPALGDAAQRAVDAARERGARRVGRYDPARDRPVPDQDQINADLRGAIEDDQLELLYQPQVDLRSGRITAVEALVRWRHPELGLLTPGRFIPEAERAGLIRQLGHHVLRHALADLARWRARGHQIAAVAVNISAAQLDEPDFPDAIAGLLADHGLVPGDLTLEVTETALAQDTGYAMGQLAALRVSGIRVAIDDFGCGYSTLSRVHAHPFDEVKLDRAFVADVRTFDQPIPVLDAAVAMAHGLGMQVVIEGVETQPQMAAAMRAGCDKAQGYLIAHPVGADDLGDQLDDQDL